MKMNMIPMISPLIKERPKLRLLKLLPSLNPQLLLPLNLHNQNMMEELLLSKQFLAVQPLPATKPISQYPFQVVQ
jgi:hypothetical protein